METGRKCYELNPLHPEFGNYSSDLRIVLLGKTGVEKSSVGNMILGREALKENSRESEVQKGRVEDRNISVIDTPGFFNPQLTDEDLWNEMMKSLSLSHPGPHVFLLIVRPDAFRECYVEMIVQKMRENFGVQVLMYVVNTDLRIVMVGKTGAGKSATGNTILGNSKFKEEISSKSVTKECQENHEMVEGKKISVTDTPGLFDTSFTNEELKDEIERCIEMSVPGPHVFLLVLRVDVRFTDEEINTVKWIHENFSDDAMNYAIVLFTRGDQLDKSIDEFLEDNKQLTDLVDKCKGGYHVLNNKVKNRIQVTELLKKINTLVEKNGGQHYTNEMYQEAQRKIIEERERVREEEEKKRKEEEENIRQDERDKVKDKVKKVALGVGMGMGAGAAIVSTVALAATPAVIIPAVLIAGGAAISGGAGGTLMIDKNKSTIMQRKKLENTTTAAVAETTTTTTDN